jgi:hypothetical protein
MGQRPPFDLTRLSSADRIIGAGAGIFFIWSILPIWYDGNATAWFGVTTIAGMSSMLALLALWTGMSAIGIAPVRGGGHHVLLAALAFLFTLIGAGDKPTGFEVKWGLWVALVWAAIWGYGAYMKMMETGAAAPPSEGGSTTP